MTVGAVQCESITITVTLRMPVIKNTKAIQEGTRLLMKAADPPKKVDQRGASGTHDVKTNKAARKDGEPKATAKAKAKAVVDI